MYIQSLYYKLWIWVWGECKVTGEARVRAESMGDICVFVQIIQNTCTCAQMMTQRQKFLLLCHHINPDHVFLRCIQHTMACSIGRECNIFMHSSAMLHFSNSIQLILNWMVFLIFNAFVHYTYLPLVCVCHACWLFEFVQWEKWEEQQLMWAKKYHVFFAYILHAKKFSTKMTSKAKIRKSFFFIR